MLSQSVDGSPAQASRLLRELVEKDRGAFLPAAVACLRQAPDSRGSRNLLAFLDRNDMLVKCLCDSSFSTQAAVQFARRAIETNPTLDTAMARGLMNKLAVEDDVDEQALLVLDILGAISNGRRLLPLLTQLLQHTNHRVRSKAALLLGRRNRNARWVEQRKDEIDPRVRANALEGLWDANDDDTHRLLGECSQEPNNRIAGNAVIGLYRQGDVRAIGCMLEMAEHPEARFRATAAWAMGESGDQRFRTILRPMLADSDKRVRARELRSLAALRQKMAELPSESQIRVYLWDARLMPDGWRRVRLAVVHRNQGFSHLPPTRFLVTDGSQAVMHYEVRRRSGPASLAVGWGLPQAVQPPCVPIEPILRECLRQKQPGSLWAIQPYSPIPAAAADSGLQTPYTPNSSALAVLLERQATAPNAVSGPLEAARVLIAAAASLESERHVVLVHAGQDTVASANDTEHLCQRARHSGIGVHGLLLSGGRSPWLERLCAATSGRLLQAGTEDQLRAAVRRIFWGLQYQEEIHYWLDKPLVRHTPVRVQVWSHLGLAEDSLLLE